LANAFRRANRKSDLIDRLAAELPAAVAGSAPDGTDRLAAALAFRRLSDDDRELLMLAAWEGLDGRQLSQLLGCSETAVRIRLHRARLRLEAEMADAGLDAKHRRGFRQSLLRSASPENAPEGA
jgi:RNA polymerase sigma-70 factor (ECF subfamily)